MDVSINHILFDFTSVFDVDIGMAMVMNTRFNNPAMVNQMVIGKSIEDYKYILLNRRYRNPIVMFLNETYQAEADAVYAQMCDNEEVYKDILSKSIPTSIYNLLRESSSQSSLDTTILCWNEWQAEYASNFTNGEFKILVRDGDNKINVDDYDTLIFKYPYHESMFEGLHGKNIYICRYRCNMYKEDATKLEMSDNVKLYHISANDIYVIDVYADAKLDVPKEEVE